MHGTKCGGAYGKILILFLCGWWNYKCFFVCVFAYSYLLIFYNEGVVQQLWNEVAAASPLSPLAMLRSLAGVLTQLSKAQVLQLLTCRRHRTCSEDQWVAGLHFHPKSTPLKAGPLPGLIRAHSAVEHPAAALKDLSS